MMATIKLKGGKQIMTNWLYRQIASTGGILWVVGFYTPSSLWFEESMHTDKEAAADRVHWLNGGNS